MTATADARAMGARAGDSFRTTGVPERNPFTRPELAAAWRRGYFAALHRR